MAQIDLSPDGFAQTIGAAILAMPIPALAIDTSERVIRANTGAQALFGEGLDGRHYITVMRQPMLLDTIENVLRLSEPASTTFRVTDSTREQLFEVTAEPVTLGEHACVIVSFEDRTDVYEAGQMRRDFVANVSHELRTPLTAIIGFIETLQGPAANDSAARTRFLDIMGKEASRMTRIVRDLLSLSRVEADRRVRPTEDVDVTAVLRSVMTSVQLLAQERGVTVELEGADAPVMVTGDFDQLIQVFTNLIENAIKYGKPEGTVDICITRHADEPTMMEPAVRIDVADQGEGIASEHIPRLTERFYRVDSHRSREMGGTGLGLAIVKHILNRHKGRLRVESHEGKGSLFSVILPQS